mmetsp:Transcript_18452/g.50662  ORF Transcript_18452/g.50662 Transcript_18452/m.50662 type:complete len:213 (+) Transcript_18452:823-1461(+)
MRVVPESGITPHGEVMPSCMVSSPQKTMFIVGVEPFGPTETPRKSMPQCIWPICLTGFSNGGGAKRRTPGSPPSRKHIENRSISASWRNNFEAKLSAVRPRRGCCRPKGVLFGISSPPSLSAKGPSGPKTPLGPKMSSSGPNGKGACLYFLVEAAPVANNEELIDVGGTPRPRMPWNSPAILSCDRSTIKSTPFSILVEDVPTLTMSLPTIA